MYLFLGKVPLNLKKKYDILMSLVSVCKWFVLVIDSFYLILFFSALSSFFYFPLSVSNSLLFSLTPSFSLFTSLFFSVFSHSHCLSTFLPDFVPLSPSFFLALFFYLSPVFWLFLFLDLSFYIARSHFLSILFNFFSFCSHSLFLFFLYTLSYSVIEHFWPKLKCTYKCGCFIISKRISIIFLLLFFFFVLISNNLQHESNYFMI